MSITDYIRACNYSLGSLKDYVYLVSKDGSKVLYHASDKTVNIDKIDGTIQKLECRGVTLNETQTLDSRFAFESEVNLTFDEIWMDTFHDALEYLRHNPCYIIIETTEGVQFLANIELHTKYTYEYTFTDSEDEGIYAVLTFTNTSNTPLLRVVNKIKEDEVLIGKLCDYSMCKVTYLTLSPKGGIIMNDGNVTSDKQYVVEWLPDTLNYIEEYNGEYFRQTLSFSIPLDDYQDYWEYRLSEFHNNKYCAVLQTLNRNLIVLGLQNALVPTYEIQTSESIDTPNLITITFEVYSMHSAYVTILPTRWVSTDLYDCVNVEEYNCFRLVKSDSYFALGNGRYAEKWMIEISDDCENFYQSGEYVLGEETTKNPHGTDTKPDGWTDEEFDKAQKECKWRVRWIVTDEIYE